VGANIELLEAAAGARPEEADSEGLAAVGFDSGALKLSTDLWRLIESFLRVEDEESEDRWRKGVVLGAPLLAALVVCSSGSLSPTAVPMEGDLTL
jgi:hypothetical protein